MYRGLRARSQGPPHPLLREYRIEVRELLISWGVRVNSNLEKQDKEW